MKFKLISEITTAMSIGTAPEAPLGMKPCSRKYKYKKRSKIKSPLESKKNK